MASYETLSKRPQLRFWGWGFEHETLNESQDRWLDGIIKSMIPEGATEVQPPALEDFDLPEPRLAVPEKFQHYVSTFVYDRLVHTYGQSFPDMVRMILRQIDNVPDWVAFPTTEIEITELFEFAGNNNMAIIPFGGGTSVCGGVEADIGEEYAGTISMDMENFNRILEVDEVSRTANIEGGIFGPDLEKQLKPYGLTLRHYPQSFRFSTLGGWIATRAGGHFASLYTHIDDMVESTRTVTPSGAIVTRRLPGSGAGPSPDRMIIGSEGIFGVLTQANMRLQKRPEWRASASASFTTLMQAVAALRSISQSGLFPSNARLLDHDEVASNEVSKEPCCMLVLGFESADHPVNAWMERALEIVAEFGGEYKPARYTQEFVKKTTQRLDQKVQRTAESENWRNAFISMPYWRNKLVCFGIILDTFETSITWDKFEEMYHGVKEGITKVIKETTGVDGRVSCRITHIYPDGPAPYFTFYAVGSSEGDLQKSLDNWRQIKVAANELVVEFGGTVTHHHSVGRDHRSGYEKQSSELYRRTLAANKAFLDPKAILNPGVLIDPQDRNVGITGALADVLDKPKYELNVENPNVDF
jgi:alkyldihydroxyacetonephosphate synthase